MELDIASKNLAHSSHFWANVPLDIYFCYDSSKITSITDGDYLIWQSSNDTYAKFVWVYSDLERPQLIDYVVTSDPSTLVGAVATTSSEKSDRLGGDVTTAAANEGSKSESNAAVHTSLNTSDPASTENKIALPPCFIDGSEELGFLRIKMYRKGNKWIRINRPDFFSKLDPFYSSLPKLTTEKGKSTIPANMANFTLKAKPKFFAIDLDGTFLCMNNKYLVENLKSFEKVRQSGYYPLICTGRSFVSSFDGFNDLIMEHTTYNGFPGVYNNGTVVFDHLGNIVSKTCFSREYLAKLLDYLQENDAGGQFLFYDLNQYYCLTDPAMVTSKLFLFYNFFKPVKINQRQLLDLEVVMIYFYKDEPDFGPFVNGVDHISKVTIFQLFTEITPPGVSKSFGVRKLMEHYELDNDKLFFVGDGENDIEIMKFLNNSFAVGDAPDFVKLHAKYILEHKHTEAAVAQLLNRVYEL